MEYIWEQYDQRGVAEKYLKEEDNKMENREPCVLCKDWIIWSEIETIGEF